MQIAQACKGESKVLTVCSAGTLRVWKFDSGVVLFFQFVFEKVVRNPSNMLKKLLKLQRKTLNQ